MIGQRLTMRAYLERDIARSGALGSDSWGGPTTPDWQGLGAPLPCFVWSGREAAVLDGGKVAMLGDMRALFALGADIAEGDEICSVTDRRGVEIMRLGLNGGRLRIEGEVQFKHTHLECALQRVS